MLSHLIGVIKSFVKNRLELGIMFVDYYYLITMRYCLYYYLALLPH